MSKKTNIIKKNIIYNNSISSSLDINHLNPINKLVSNMIDINELLNSKQKNMTQKLYSNIDIIEDILYYNEEIINLDNILIEDIINNYFYLDLLIRGNDNIINYNFSINLVKNINKLLKKDNNFLIKKVIISKIIIDLINYYKQTDNYDEDEEEEELKKIEEENEYYIKNNLYIFNDLNLNYTVYDIKKKKIDLIYIEIIIALIIEKKFDDYEYTESILNQLDMENINLTETMVKELFKLFNCNDKNIMNYYNFENINNQNTINFYYLLFKYILKNSIYIYQNKYLYTIRKNLIKKKIQLNEKLEDELKEKINYVIESFLDSKYYILKYNNLTEDFESTALKIHTEDNEFKSLENNDKINITNLTEKDLKLFILKILYQSSFILKSNEKGKIFISILNDKIDEKEFKNRKKFKKIEENIQNLEKNFIKLLEFLNVVKEEIEKEYINKFNLIIKLDFYMDEYKQNNSNSIYNMICRYYFYPPNNDGLLSFQDENILISGINGGYQGFYFLMSQINDTYYNNILYKKNLNISEIIKEKDKNEKNSEYNVEKKEKKFSLLDIVKSDIVSENEIIKLKDIIGIHSNSAEFIQLLSNGYLISGGNSRSLYIYDQDYKKITEINLSIHPIGAYQIKKQENKTILKIVAFSNENINIISFETNNNAYIIQSYKAYASNIQEINSDKYIISNEKGTYITKDLMSSLEKNELKKIINYSYKGITKISDEIIALSSNSIMPNGKSKLEIYDINSNKSLFDFETYSFSLCINSLLLMDNHNSFKGEKILLCACKKYTGYQNNGILLVNINLEKIQDYFDFFYDTKNFEPYCFCPILLIDTSKDKKNKSEREYETNYLLVGGFDLEKGEGVIKLYKIIYDYEAYNTKIEYVQDIIIMENEKKDFYGFKGAVNCIKQSKNDGNFLISCSDGNVCLFTPANINYFLFYDEQDKKKLNYDETTFYDSKIEEEVNKNMNKVLQINNTEILKILLNKFKSNISFNLSFLLLL